MQKFEEWVAQNERLDSADPFTAAKAAWLARDAEIGAKQRECDILKSSVENYIKIVGGLEAELADLRGRMEALAEACKLVLPRLAHPAKCMELNPTETWNEKGSMNFDNCTCGISAILAALGASAESMPELIRAAREDEFRNTVVMCTTFPLKQMKALIKNRAKQLAAPAGKGDSR